MESFANVPSTPKKGPKLQRILLAKQIEGQGIKNAIPLSIFKKSIGSKQGWKPNKKNILGDWEDFKEIEKIHGFVELEQVEPETNKIEQHTEPLLEVAVDPIKNEMEPITIKEDEKRQKWLERLLIFQRYQELREEHALDNWKRHSIEWNKIEDSVAKKSGKKPEELLMARLGEYRQKVESKQLIEEALMLLEEQNINFWKDGFRIGNDLLGLSIQLPRGGPRQIERLHQNEPSRNKKPSGQSYFEKRKNELSQLIQKLDPFYKVSNTFIKHEGQFLETLGCNVMQVNAGLAEAYLERLEMVSQQNETKVTMTETMPSIDEDSETSKGLVLKASTKRLFFEVNLNQISTSIVTIYNQGSVAVHFEWTKLKKKNPLNTRKCNDDVQRFFLNYTKGVILPGTAFDFPIIFQSSKNGIFSETWKLNTLPQMSAEKEITIALQGISYEPDHYKEKREAVDKLIMKRRASALAKEALATVMKRVQSAQKKSEILAKDIRRKQFEERNKLLRLHFHPLVYEQLLDLSTKVYELTSSNEIWNGSVSLLCNQIELIQNHDMRSEYLAKLNNLVTESTKDEISGHNLMCVISNEIIVNLSFKLVDVSEELRKKMALPNKIQSFAEVDEEKENVDSDNQKGGDPKKNGAQADVKKGVPVAKADPKKAAPPPAAKVDPKKVPGKKSDQPEIEDSSPQPKKKKPLSSTGWSPERKSLETKYLSSLHAAMRIHVYDAIGRMTGLFGDTS